tara:strand:+ start:286 stop:504 length:219 start_codon:yes stop_codon:yes gene_type:complete
MNDINAIYLKVVGDALSDLAEDPSLTLSMAINNGLDDIQGLSEEEAEEVYHFATAEIQRRTLYLDAYDRSEV